MNFPGPHWAENPQPIRKLSARECSMMLVAISAAAIPTSMRTRWNLRHGVTRRRSADSIWQRPCGPQACPPVSPSSCAGSALTDALRPRKWKWSQHPPRERGRRSLGNNEASSSKGNLRRNWFHAYLRCDRTPTVSVAKVRLQTQLPIGGQTRRAEEHFPRPRGRRPCRWDAGSHASIVRLARPTTYRPLVPTEIQAVHIVGTGARLDLAAVGCSPASSRASRRPWWSEPTRRDRR